MSATEASVVAAVVYSHLLATQEKKWIPPDVKIPVFGKYDLWMYNAVLDDRLCDQCLQHEKTPRYLGSELRTKFPYLEVVNDDLILAKVHPNCRCTLNRVTEWTLDDIKWFVSYIGD